MKIEVDEYFVCLSCKSFSFLGGDLPYDKATFPRTLTCDECNNTETIGVINDALGGYEKEEFATFVEIQLLHSDFITSSEEKGNKGEEKFFKWLDNYKLPYIFIEQSKDSFAQVFKGDVKRPDFLLSLENSGSFVVDVKNRELYTSNYGSYLSLSTTKVDSPYLEFEKIFNVPVWFAYVDPNKKDNWLWISAKDAISKGKELTDKKNKKKFLSINIRHFNSINDRSTLEKLFEEKKTLANKATYQVAQTDT